MKYIYKIDGIDKPFAEKKDVTIYLELMPAERRHALPGYVRGYDRHGKECTTLQFSEDKDGFVKMRRTKHER